MHPRICINGRTVGPNFPVYLVAEMSANHSHNLDHALTILKAARLAGADAVKVQTYTPDTMTLDCEQEHFRIKGTIWAGRRLHDLYGEAALPWEWHGPLLAAARDLGLDFFSTPFDATAVTFLQNLGVPAYKIASFELVDLPLLRAVAATNKPVILSTGMATLGEIEEAVTTLRQAGCRELALLKCTSAYPADPVDMNLLAMPELERLFSAPAGLSDHTLGSTMAVAATALGATIIEKHFTLSREIPSPDSAFSMEPDEFQAMATAVRQAQAALGGPRFSSVQSEEAGRALRRSLYVAADMAAGEPFTLENVRCVRPGGGLHPRHYQEILGRRARTDIPKGTPMSFNLLE